MYCNNNMTVISLHRHKGTAKYENFCHWITWLHRMISQVKTFKKLVPN